MRSREPASARTTSIFGMNRDSIRQAFGDSVLFATTAFVIGVHVVAAALVLYALYWLAWWLTRAI